ncbi:MAG: hypothetical protein R3F61_12955 [Myxococcota bacterium]
MTARDTARRFIPAAQALTLVTTAACGSDPAIGNWVGTSWTYEGDTIALPYTYTYTYGSYTYTSEITHKLSITEEFTGSFDLSFTHTANGASESSSDTNSLTAIKIAKGQWDLSIPSYYTLELTCIATGDTMNCTGIDEDDASYDLDYVREL